MLKCNRFGTCLLACLAALVMLAGAAWPGGAAAQAGEMAWSAPRNLSQSGSASQPHLVVDSSGRASLVWLDEYDGLMAAQEVGGAWSAPVRMNLPFDEHLETLKLAAGPSGLVYAAWIDDEGSLFTSQVRGESFLSVSAWSPALFLAYTTAAFDLAASEQELQLIFLRASASPDYPAGVYALRVIGSSILSTPRLLQDSAYYRGLEVGEGLLSVATGPGGQVIAAWGDPALEQVLAAASADEGESWSSAQALDRRKPDDGSGQGPSKPQVFFAGGQALLTWQAGHQGKACSYYSSASTDGGASWSEATSLPAPLDQGCGASLQYLGQPGELGLFLVAGASEASLLAWQPGEGGRWSETQLQSALSGFTHPETFRPVSLGCLQAGLAGERLQVVGCERAGQGDLWQLERSLGTLADWFPAEAAEPIWGEARLLSGNEDGEEARIVSAVLAADALGRLHAVWFRPGDANLYYAQWDGERWTGEQAVVKTSGTLSQQVSMGIAGDGASLFVVWNDPVAGGLYYSLAPVVQALEASGWLTPQALPTGELAAAMPQALVEADGRLAVIFAAPYNEGRGIYLLESDAPLPVGQRPAWGEAQLVFDAAAAGWESLSEPRLAQAADGSLLATWKRDRLPPATQTSGLYAARRSAAGWSEPETVYSGQVTWSLAAAAGGELHRAWQAVVSGQPVLFHQVSSDNGVSWSAVGRVSSQAGGEGRAGLAVEASGGVHLVQISNPANQASSPQLSHWSWQAGQWRALESQLLASAEGRVLLEANVLSAAAPPGGLAVLYNGVEEVAESGAGEGGLARRAILAAAARGGLAEGPTQAATVTPGVKPGPGTPTLSTPEGAVGAEEQATLSIPSPTPTFSKSPPGGLVNRIGGTSGVLIFGALPAALIVLVVFIRALRKRLAR
jgi:hypothetical protein